MSEPVIDSTASAAPATGTSRTWSHTCGSGVPTDGTLLAWCRIGYVSQTDPLVSAKYNAVDAPQLIAYGFVGNEWVYGARWASPAAGAHNVVFDFGAVSASIAGMSVSFTNAAQGNLNSTSRLGLTAQAAMLGTITPTIANCWIGVFASNSLEVPAVGFNSTIIGSATQRATLSQRNPPALPDVEAYPWLTTSGNADWMAISFALGPYEAPPAPPPSGNPNTSRDIFTKPTVPTLGAAGFSYNDSIFGTLIIRATDRLTASTLLGQTDHSWSPPSAVNQRPWASDSTHFYVINRNGSVLLMDFNPSTKTRAERELLGGGFFGEPSFSRTNPNYLYLAAGNSHKLLKRADLSTNPATYSTVFDAEALIPALSADPNSYMRGGFTCDNDVIVCNAGGGNQDLTQYVIWYPFSNPANKKILNTRTRAEMFKSYGVGPTLHAATPDTSGRYVLLRVSAFQQLDGYARSDSLWVWDTTLDSLTEITASPDGHYSLGYGFMVNQSVKAGSTYDAMQWLMRDLATPNTVTELINPVLRPASVFSEDHTSLVHSTAANPRVPAISATYRDWDGPYTVSPKNTEPWRAWDEEILGIPTDGRGGPVPRYGQHRSLTWNEPLSTRGNVFEFSALPLFGVSMDGRWMIVNSNMDHTLGLCTHDYDPLIHRTDTFIVELVPSTPVTPPTPVFRGRRGSRSRSR